MPARTHTHARTHTRTHIKTTPHDPYRNHSKSSTPRLHHMIHTTIIHQTNTNVINQTHHTKYTHAHTHTQIQVFFFTLHFFFFHFSDATTDISWHCRYNPSSSQPVNQSINQPNVCVSQTNKMIMEKETKKTKKKQKNKKKTHTCDHSRRSRKEWQLCVQIAQWTGSEWLCQTWSLTVFLTVESCRFIYHWCKKGSKLNIKLREHFFKDKSQLWFFFFLWFISTCWCKGGSKK